MTAVEISIRRPSSVDVHVGGRVRVRRRLIHMTQETLADLIAVTFQQVQKYERGTNRISASKLFAIAESLDVPISYFFEGLDATDGDGPGVTEGSEQNIQNFLRTGEGLELARLFPRIGRGPLRRRILELVRAAAMDGAEVEAE
ncbi:MAG TPA: helix-turn-helix transcriptional regulator [Caulobacteraceae bacterium]